jgi:hypothetical protein
MNDDNQLNSLSEWSGPRPRNDFKLKCQIIVKLYLLIGLHITII